MSNSHHYCAIRYYIAAETILTYQDAWFHISLLFDVFGLGFSLSFLSLLNDLLNLGMNIMSCYYPDRAHGVNSWSLALMVHSCRFDTVFQMFKFAQNPYFK